MSLSLSALSPFLFVCVRPLFFFLTLLPLHARLVFFFFQIASMREQLRRTEQDKDTMSKEFELEIDKYKDTISAVWEEISKVPELNALRTRLQQVSLMQDV